MNLYAANVLLEVAEDHVVRDAAEASSEVHRDFVERFSHAGLHHHEHVLHAGERRTFRTGVPGIVRRGGGAVESGLNGEELVQDEDHHDGRDHGDASAISTGRKHPYNGLLVAPSKLIRAVCGAGEGKRKSNNITDPPE